MGRSVLVVGAGFAGAVHARAVAEAGLRVVVIDKRSHIGGNAYDFTASSGVRVHKYGPHLFHTNNEKVFRWLSQFTAWVPYEHRVKAVLEDGRFVPLPVNLETINAVFGTSLASETDIKNFLVSISASIQKPQNAAEYLISRIGEKLTNLFFRPYTQKMWGLRLEEIDEAIVRRIPLRFDGEDRYFPNDKFQFLPAHGYTHLFEKILDHDLISVRTETPYTKGMEEEFDFCFNSMPIDEWFDFSLGELPYRSIRFISRECELPVDREWAVTNFTDTGKYTRETWWHVMPNHIINETGRRTLTLEEPCDYRDNNMERYYPVKTADGRYQILYDQYNRLASELSNMRFIGRCGTYQYLNMDQVINQSLVSVSSWLSSLDVGNKFQVSSGNATD
jgi:UDP-galactopyranose mutase